MIKLSEAPFWSVQIRNWTRITRLHDRSHNALKLLQKTSEVRLYLQKTCLEVSEIIPVVILNVHYFSRPASEALEIIPVIILNMHLLLQTSQCI